MAYIIGIDTGGTKISIVLARQSGKIIEKQILRTKLHRAAQESINEILKVIKALLEKHGAGKQLAAIGVGVPGAIDTQKGIITRSPNLPGWAGIPIRKILQYAFHVPIFLDNDANVACLGEKYFGAGRSFENFVYITVSTGVGGGVIANGRLMRGVGGYAGEIGHIVVHPNGRDCNCGKRGCLEAYASGTAMAKTAREKIRRLSRSQRKKSMIARCLEEREGTISAANIADAARAGERLARDIFDEAGHDLGLGLSIVIQVLNPEAIIFGGSVSKAFTLFRKAMTKALKENTWGAPLKECAILRSPLGDEVADLGTIALVKENMRL